MNTQEAERIFAALGANLAELDEASLHRAWIRAARALHPDQGGSHDEAALLNAAYTTLREDVRQRASEYAARRWRATSRDPKRNGVAVWAWAGANGHADDRIERFDLSDRNFVKRRLWEISGESQEEWTIWPFDGRSFLEPLTVYGSPKAFVEMVQAANEFARSGFRRPRAVLATRAKDRFEAYLIGLGGQPLPRPEKLLITGSPATDRSLVNTLRARVMEGAN